MFVCYRTKPLSARDPMHCGHCSAVKVQQARQGVAHCRLIVQPSLFCVAYLQSDLGNLVPSMITLLISLRPGLRLKMRGRGGTMFNQNWEK